MPTVAAIVPALDAETTLPRCLAALAALPSGPDELVVVDDGSTDGTARIAEEAGARCLRVVGGPRGPAFARNRGAAATQAEVLLFVDADVVIQPEALERLLAPFLLDERCVATYGSYDDRPAATDPVSLYANLRHHVVHQMASSEAETFWAGLGCVRRTTFVELGGFDESYARPSIEDIEFGMRAHASGARLWLVHGAFGKHLKRWTLRSLWKTDVHCRALPWSRLIVERGAAARALNVSRRERATAMLTAAIPVAGVGALWIDALGWFALALFASWLWMGRRLLRLHFVRGGLRALATGVALHFAYYVYSTLAYLWARTFVESAPPRAAEVRVEELRS